MGKSVLIIENEHVICDYLEQVFSGKGWRVFKSYDLVSALNVLVQVENLNLILLDIMMEVIPGTDASAKNAGIAAVGYFYTKLQEKNMMLPNVVAFTAVTEVIPDAKSNKLIGSVVDKNSTDWVNQLLKEAEKVI